MNAAVKLFLGFICIIITGFIFAPKGSLQKPVPVVSEVQTPASVVGCYVATLGKDVYTLTVRSQNGSDISGNLVYNNYQKDSSKGSFTGTYSNNFLIGDYVFTSEGMNSVRQVVFKKTSEGFVQGFGPTKVVGNREFQVNPTKATFDSKMAFVFSDTCNVPPKR